MTLRARLVWCFAGCGLAGFCAAGAGWLQTAIAQSAGESDGRQRAVTELKNRWCEWAHSQKRRLEGGIEAHRQALALLAEQLAGVAAGHDAAAEPAPVPLPPTFVLELHAATANSLIDRLGQAALACRRENAVHPRMLDRLRERLASDGSARAARAASTNADSGASIARLDDDAVALQYFYAIGNHRPGMGTHADRSPYGRIRRDAAAALERLCRDWRLDDLLLIDGRTQRVVYTFGAGSALGRRVDEVVVATVPLAALIRNAAGHAVARSLPGQDASREIFAVPLKSGAGPGALAVFTLSGAASEAFGFESVGANRLLESFRQAHQAAAGDLTVVDAASHPVFSAEARRQAPSPTAFNEELRAAVRRACAEQRAAFVPATDRCAALGALVQPVSNPRGRAELALTYRLSHDVLTGLFEPPPGIAACSLCLVCPNRQVCWSKRIGTAAPAVPAVRPASAANRPGVLIMDESSQSPALVAVAPLDLFGTTWTFEARTDLAAPVAAAGFPPAPNSTFQWRLAYAMSGTGAAVGFGATLFGLVASGRFTRPVQAAAELVARATSDFDFSRRLQPSDGANSASLARRLNELFSRLHCFVSDAQTREAQQQTSAQDLASAAGDLAQQLAQAAEDAGAAESPLGRATDAARRTTKQCADARTQLAKATAPAQVLEADLVAVATAADALAATAPQVAGSAKSQTAAFATVIAQTENANALDRRAQASSTAASSRIAELSASATRIAPVVGLIIDVADRTRLLALNAAIEAANAGEAGRGFTVVANEVKELARQASAAAGQIAEQVQQVQSEAAAARQTVTQAGAAVDELAREHTAIATALKKQAAANTQHCQLLDSVAQSAHSLAAQLAHARTAATTGRAHLTTASTAVAAIAENVPRALAALEGALVAVSGVRQRTADGVRRAHALHAEALSQSGAAPAASAHLPAPSASGIPSNGHAQRHECDAPQPRYVTRTPHGAGETTKFSHVGRVSR